MTTDPKISVIVANYNHSDYIEEAVGSILGQTFMNYEIIIIDDGSTDGSQEVIDKLSWDYEEVTAILNKENRGKWSVLNQAIGEAKGKLITLQDADDASCPDRLQRQWQVMQDQGSYHNLCGFTHCHSAEEMAAAQTWKPSGSGYPIMKHDDVTRQVHIGRKTNGINHYFVGQDYEVHGASSMFYKQLWEHGMKFLPGNMGLRCQLAEDSDHNTKMTLLLQKTSVLKEPLYAYRRGTATNNAFKEGL
jgi:glycosyltransferase involved in cell wall biosynthesis